MGKRGKKGAGHIEVIMSFILFVSFVLFLLFYIRPYNTTGLTDSIILGLHDSFEKQTNTDLTRIFLKEETDKSCFSVNLAGIEMQGNSLVKTGIGEEEVGSYFSRDFITIDSSETEEGSFYIFISPEFGYGAIPCDGAEVLGNEDYTIGSVTKKILISDKAMLELKNRYETDYDNLKKDFRIPETIDFGIHSEDYVLEKLIPKKAEVMSRVYTHEILSEDGLIENRAFIFRVW